MGAETNRTPGAKRWMTGFVAMLIVVSVPGAVIGVSALVRMASTLPPNRDGAMRDHALQCARSGLTDAINWLRRQPRQPVVEFAPTQVDSMDPRIGMVREFPITERLWGRFEVWRGGAAGEEDPLRRHLAVRDVSIEAGHPAPGAVWRLRGVGFVFARDRVDEPFDRNSAAVLCREVLEVEVARIGLRLPGEAALCVRDVTTLVVGNHARIDGGPSAVGVYSAPRKSGAAPMAEARAGSLRGASGSATAASRELFDDSVISVFGVDRRTLFTMADACVTDADDLPSPLAANSLHCVDVPLLTYTAARPLRGSGILFVKGDLSIEPGSAARFDGLLYVDGDLVVHSRASFRGAVVVTGAVSIQGGRKTAELIYDDGILRRLCDALGSYRMATPVTRVRERNK
jgi:hypothetical protein